MSDTAKTEYMNKCSLTKEYERIGVKVKQNHGLSSPVMVNVLTGVMHRISVEGMRCRAACEPPYMLSETYPEGRALLGSLSNCNFIACRKCEKLVKKRGG